MEARPSRLRRKDTVLSIRPRTRKSELGAVDPGRMSSDPSTWHPSSAHTDLMMGSPSRLFVRTILSPLAAIAAGESEKTNTANIRQTSHRDFIVFPCLSVSAALPLPRPSTTTRHVERPDRVAFGPSRRLARHDGEGSDLGDADTEAEVLGRVGLQHEFPEVIRQRAIHGLRSLERDHRDVLDGRGRVLLVHELSHDRQPFRVGRRLEPEADRVAAGLVEELPRGGAGGTHARRLRLPEAVEDQRGLLGHSLEQPLGPAESEVALELAEGLIRGTVGSLLIGDIEHRSPKPDGLRAARATLFEVLLQARPEGGRRLLARKVEPVLFTGMFVLAGFHVSVGHHRSPSAAT